MFITKPLYRPYMLLLHNTTHYYPIHVYIYFLESVLSSFLVKQFQEHGPRLLVGVTSHKFFVVYLSRFLLARSVHLDEPKTYFSSGRPTLEMSFFFFSVHSTRGHKLISYSSSTRSQQNFPAVSTVQKIKFRPPRKNTIIFFFTSNTFI